MMIPPRVLLLRHIVCLKFLGFFIFLVGPAAGQAVVRGTVLDAETGESLPAAHVAVEGALRGTITNAEGAFVLELETLPAALLVQYIGYETRRLIVSEAPPGPVEIALQPVVYRLGEIEVTDEDPAIAIMRRVIERKQAWRARLQGFRAEAYNRFTLKNDTGIVSIIESFTETYWNPVDGMREVVKARRRTNNLEFDEFLPAAQFVANLYDDDLDIAGYTFIGVTHPDALDHYRFSLQGYRRRDDRLVYDIRVEPRTRFKTAFHGRVSVLDEAFAMIEAELEPGEAFLFPPPVRDFTVTYRQQFSDFGGDFWLPVDFRAAITLDVGFNALLTFPTFHIDQVSRLSNYEVNVAPPDTLFARDVSVVVDSAAVAADTLLDRAGVAVPLNRAEVAAYAAIDSTMTLARAYKPSGALARFVDLEEESSDSGAEVRAGTRRGGLLKRFDVTPHLRFNRVEGLYGEARVEGPVAGFLRIHAAGGVSTALRGEGRFSYDVGATLEAGENDLLSVEAGYAAYTDVQWPAAPFLRTLNGVVVLFAGDDYYDYFRNERLRAAVALRPVRGLRAGLGVRSERHRSLSKTTDYDLLAHRRIARPNPRVDEGRLRSIQASLHYGDDDDAGGLAGRRRIALDVEHSDPGLMASAFDYTTYRMAFEWRVETFFRRRLLPNALDVVLIGHTARGRPPVQRLGVLDGRLGLFNRPGVFRAGDGLAVRGRRFAGLFWEHNFRTVIFEALGLDGLARRAFNVIVFGAHAYTSENIAGLSTGAPVLYAGGWRHEAGVSLSGLFSLLRIDFAVRLDHPGFGVGLGAARIF